MGNVVSAVRGSRVDDRSPQHAAPQTMNTALPQARSRSSQRSAFLRSRHNTFSGPRRRRTQQELAQHTQLGDGNHDEILDRLYEQEDHPLFSGSHNPPAEIRAGRPLTWRHSTISRIGSRLMPDSIVRGPGNSGEELTEEGQPSVHGLSNRDRLETYHRRTASSSNDALSILVPQERTMPDSRGNASRIPTRRLVYQNTDYSDNTLNLSASSQLSDIPVSRRRGTRLSRIRNSISAPFSNVLGPSHSRSLSRLRLQSPPPRSSHPNFMDDSDELLSRSFRARTHHESDENTPHELDAVEPEARNLLLTSRSTSGLSSIRRIPHGFRSRSTRLIRRGEHPPLSQVLQLAAAAIAAQLSGTSTEGSNGARPLAGHTFDGSIHNFVQTLQDAANAQAGENPDHGANDDELPPVNFMRVFQFPNDENGTPLSTLNGQRVVDEVDMTDVNGSVDRSVTLVLVGVRSMPNIHDNITGESAALGSSLDTLLSLPFLPPANILRNGSSSALFRRSDNRYRSQNRRHSMTNFNFPQQYESQRHAGARHSNARASEGLSNSTHLSPILMSDSPPGPNPPPSTPADIRSGNATPNRRPSSASMAHAPGLPDLSEDQDISAPNLPAESAFNTARHRRRSDSEFARRPELSSGNSRRNGVVEPDRPPPGAGRSWLIYVVGTNVASDHPAFTMPSLFTENPTYEDMQMLSTLLGPVKPPVATQEDLEIAGGLYNVLSRNGLLMAEPVNNINSERININAGDRCLICLSEYEENDSVRQIYSCSHMFHRECIDEWLTTGRNSCPMCRGQGVKEVGTPTSADQAEAAGDRIA